jgi:hypothetical protein
MLSRARQSRLFTPADLGPSLWLEADQMNTLFTEIAGTTTPGDTDTVGRWEDKSMNGFHLTATADNTTRPVWALNSGLSYVSFNGTNDILRRAAALGMYAAGSASVFIAMRSSGQAGSSVFTERNSAATAALYGIISHATDANDACCVVRNDANTITSPGASLSPSDFADEAYDGTDFVLGVTDSGSLLSYYDDGALVDTGAYTRSGTLTLNRTALCASFGSDTPGGFIAARIYALVAVLRVLNSTEIKDLTRYLGRKIGRML